MFAVFATQMIGHPPMYQAVVAPLSPYEYSITKTVLTNEFGSDDPAHAPDVRTPDELLTMQRQHISWKRAHTYDS